MARQPYTFSPNKWSPGQPITQSLMNTIEEELVALSQENVVDEDLINKIISYVVGATGNIASTSGLPGGKSDLLAAVRAAYDAGTTAQSQVSALNQSANQGTLAWQQLVYAGVVMNNEQVVTTSLDNILEAMRTSIGSAAASAGDAQTMANSVNGQITNTFGIRQIYDSGTSTYRSPASLVEVVTDLYNKVDLASNTANTALNTINPVLGPTFSERLQKLDGNLEPSRTVPTIISEIDAAKGEHYASVAARLDAIDNNTQLSRNVPSLITEVNEAHRTNSDTLNNRFIATETLANNALTTANTAVDEITAAHRDSSDTLTQRFNNVETGISDINTLIGSGFNASNTIAQTLEGLTTNTNDRLTDIEEELTQAHTSSVLQTMVPPENEGEEPTYVDTAYESLDARLEAIESLASTARADVDTIANELSMFDVSDTITDAHSRIDQLEQNVVTIANEIGMLQDGAAVQDMQSAITGVGSRIDNIKEEIDAAHRTSEDTLAARFAAVETTANAAAVAAEVNTALNGLDARLDAIDGGETLTGASTLAARVADAEQAITALEEAPKSATVVVEEARITYDSEGLPTLYETSEKATAITPSADADYLLEKDNKYYYWKYIETTDGFEWALISGGGNGGTGSSSGIIAATLPAPASADANTDYYIGNNTDGYTHYRYIPAETDGEDGVFISILPNGLINSIGVNTISVMTDDATQELPATYETMSGGLTAYSIADSQHATNLLSNFTALRHVRIRDVYTGSGDNQVLDHQELIFTDTNGTTSTLTIRGGGGGTSGGSAYSARLRNGSGATTLVYPAQANVPAPVTVIPEVKFGGELVDPADVVINIAAQWSRTNDSNSIWTNFYTSTATNGSSLSINTAGILETGVQTYIRVQMTTTIDEENYSATAPIFSVSKVEMSIQALNFNPAVVRTGNLVFQYRTMGSGLRKEVHFLIDGVDAVTPVITDSHNGTLNQTIPLSGAGAHTFQVYFTTNGVKSNELNYYILYNNEADRVEPLIGIAAPSSITYGDGLNVKYTVATIGSQNNKTEKVKLELYTDSQELKTVEYLDVTNEQEQTWALAMADYPMPEDNAHPVIVHVRGTAYHTVDGVEYTDTHTIDVVINALELPEGFVLAPDGEANLVYSYTAYGRSNNDLDKNEYHYAYQAHDANNTTINWTGAFNNFNWSTNGYVGDQALTISGGATHTIDVPIFSTTYNGTTLEYGEFTNCAQNGRTIEIEYEVQSATDLNDVIIECMNDDNSHVGFKITPQSCYLLNSSTDVSLATDGTGTILNESSIAAAYLSPNTRNHLVFVIEPWAEEKAYDGKYHQSVNIYLNGEFVNACPYAIDNSTRAVADDFTTDATIRMGSASCIIKLYNIKLYNRGLTHSEVLHNYEVIPATTTEKLARFEYNNVLTNGLVDYEKARKHFTCLLLKGPAFTPAENEQHHIYNATPTISPYKGAPSPISRKDKTGEVVGKTESALTLTMPDNSVQGYKVEFDLQDKLTDGGYASSNNVQGTSSQKYPIHNLKIYLAKGAEGSEVSDENNNLIGYSKSSKVKYKIPGSKGKGESTLCWKADYMSTDHANTYNANIADSLYSQSLNPDITNEDWQANVQNTVNGIRCLLFEQNGTAAPIFVADGCLNNDKGNSKTYGLEYPAPEDPAEVDPNAEYDVDGTADTVAQKWEFTNNSDDLGYFKYDSVFLPTGSDSHYRALDAFESCYPDQGDLEDAQDAYKSAHDNAEDPNLNPNYNHLQILLSWVAQRANYWNESATPTGETYTYNGNTYDNLRDYKKAIFKNEFTWHFNLDHTLIYYIFSQYVALCDNRVKNMFMRSDTIRKETIKLTNGETLFTGNNNPNHDFFKQFTRIDTGAVNSQTNEPIYAYNMANVNDIDWVEGEGHSHFAIWAPVLYDLDSCFGVENVGLLKIPYNADWQYQDNGDYLFNGHDSVLWLMFEDSFDREIRTKAKALYDRDRGLNYNTFYQEQIVDNQNETAPAMTNQDMLLKFDAPWATGFMNYAEKPPVYQTPEYKYLQRGTRAAQKRQFIAKRSMLLASKYSANEFLNNRISLRYGADLAAENAVLQIQGNQIFYPAASFGDNKGWTQATSLLDGTPVVDGRVEANQTCVIRSTSDAKGQDTLFIGGAKVLTDIGDLSPFRPYEIKLGGAVNLKRLIFGSDKEGYVNTRTGEAGIEGLSNCALLEEINIQNCTSSALTGLDLSSNGLIKRVYTKGSNIKTVSLPAGGILTTLELSSSVENITIRNQSYFNTFIYQDAATNNYENVNRLWIENTPNVPIVDIVNHAMSHLTNGVRLIGVDLDLGSDPFFLETITSDIAKNKYLDNNGSRISSIEYPEITGKIKITRIRASLLQKIKSIYKNLIIYANVDNQGNPIEINGNDIIQEFEIKYYNYGYVPGESDSYNQQWLLYTDHRTDQEHYIDPVSTYIDDLDPVTGRARIEMPTKPADAQYSYQFGTYTDDGSGNLTYDRFSGWKKEGADTNPTADDYVQGTTIFIAQYPTTADQYYIVRWFAEPNQDAIQTIRAKYGTDITLRTQPEENNSFAKAKIVNEQYKVFKGWNRPIGKLTADTDIYAIWEVSSISGNSVQSIKMDELTAADLYAISNLGSDAKQRLLGDKLTGADPIAVKMGNDFYFTEGVNTVDLLNGAEKVRLTGDSSSVLIKNDITPLATLMSDWTLAIDYKFLMDQTSYNNGREFVLLSCYQNADSSIQGFKVSLNKGTTTGDSNMYVHVTWGTATTTTAVDTITLTGDSNTKKYCKSYRNVIVLRHSAAEPENLYVYSTGFNTENYLNNEIYTATLTWNNKMALNSPLIIGGNYSGASTEIETSSSRRPAKAMVYWAKYWDVDLGRKNCRLLAAWPHETEYFVLTGYDNNQGDNRETTARIMPGTKLTFFAAQGFGDRAITTPTISDTSRMGWGTSSLRTLCNDRIYNAFPMTYRSIIGKYPITSTYFNAVAAGNTYNTESVDGTAETQDYIYLASEQEVGGVVSSTYKQDECLRFWPWLSASNVNALTVSNDVLVDANLTSINPLRYRFLGRPFTTNARIFYGTTNPANVDEWTYQYTENGVQKDEQISVQSGDIWYTEEPSLNEEFHNSGNAFIYYTNAEINEGVYVDIVTTNGGWKRAGMWELRTYHDDQNASYGNPNRFDKVNEQGTLILPTTNGVGSTSTRILCPEFSI